MTCQRCGEEIREIYTWAGNGTARRVPVTLHTGPFEGWTQVIWLCADCVDEVAEATA